MTILQIYTVVCRSVIGFILAVMAFVFGLVFCAIESSHLDLESMIVGPRGSSSVVLDASDVELFRFSQERCDFATFDQIPQILVNAFIAAEDRAFFGHHGLSLRGIVRSIIVNLTCRRKAQGASTITQQLARLICVGHEKTFARKFKEVFIALRLEHALTKEQIFELYVNNIYFGHGIYGIHAAARQFWGKSLEEISLSDAAVLAAIAKSAYFYSPLNSLDGATSRRNVVLKAMRSVGSIVEEELVEAMENAVEVFPPVDKNKIRPYLKEWIRCWAENKWGADALYRDGLVIRITIDSAIQKAAEDVFRDHIEKVRNQVAGVNGGLLSIEPSTGKIRAMVGGIDFAESRFNRAFQAVRQLGSSFKPVVYAAAISDGMDFDDELVDEPLEVDLGGGNVWNPKNWDGKFSGKMTLRDALAISNNVIAIKLFLEVGVEKVIDMARKFGFTRQLVPYPSLALGVAEATVHDSLAAFNVFANGGVRVEPYMIESVCRGVTRLHAGTSKRRRVLDPDASAKMVDALSYTVARYGRLKGAVDGVQCIGKSGSTNEAGTMWFVGAAPSLATAIYIGRDDGKPLGKHFFALPTMYPIWRDFYRKLVPLFGQTSFYTAPNAFSRMS